MTTIDSFNDYEKMYELYSIKGETLENIGKLFNKTKQQVFAQMKKLKIGRYDYKNELFRNGKSICSKCCQVKDLKDFTVNQNKGFVNGIKSTCKSCDSQIGRDWYTKNDEITKKRAREHRVNNPERHRELAKNKIAKHRKEQPHIHRIRGLLRRFIDTTKQNKSTKTTIMLGYTHEDFKVFVENSLLPLEGNHVDHKCPISWFKTNVPASVANSLDNLQIISENENETKSQWWAHPLTPSYYNQIKFWLKDEYSERFILQGDYYVDVKSMFYTS